MEFQFPSNGKAHSDRSNSIKESKKHDPRRKFQFPSNGKAHSDEDPYVALLVPESDFFVSIPLQTGRHIQTVSSGGRGKRPTPSHMFQFPSNGKAHSDRREIAPRWFAILTDKESFNSLQTGRHIQTESEPLKRGREYKKCFNSLQTGRHIQTQTRSFLRFRSSVIRMLSFNSLQTGRHIQTPTCDTLLPDPRMSSRRFQFPSNGKAHSDRFRNHLSRAVSRYSRRFQFPSNGKAHSD